MRRAAAAIFCIILIFALAGTVSAATGASGGTLTAVISPNGSCQVTLDLQLHLDGTVSNFTYPVPSNARSITLNGNTARVTRSGGVANVKLSSVLGNVAGDFTVRLQYTIPKVVEYDENGKLMLTLPLLSGFDYPIQQLDFSITLPGEFSAWPMFSSGYYLQAIESNMVYTITGSSITGQVINELKDRETMTMTLEVTDALFPQDPVSQWSMGVEEILMIVLSVLAAAYWIFFLRSAPFLSRRQAVPPEGYTAGEFAGLLNGYGNDLTMMIFSWAQMGYILIHLQDSGRVTLHKRMEMGNERDPDEVRIFRKLFGKRRYIDGTGYHYANLCRKVAAEAGCSRALYKRFSGNPRVFRFLCVGIGVLGGITLGSTIVGDALLGILLIVILAMLGGISAWVMQDWVKGLHSHDRLPMYLGLGLAAVWCLLGIMTGMLNVTACIAGAQLLCGVASAYGGRRTGLGRQTVAQFLGFRRYLNKLSVQDIQRISRTDPDYFFSIAPHALALGVCRPFAKCFRNRRLSACPYLTTGMDAHMTALEWCHVMERAAQSLDARQKRLFLERLTGK